MNTLYLLIGLPACGKSYWTIKNATEDVMIISSDNYIEERAKEAGITYNEAFGDHVKAASKHIFDMADEAMKLGRDVVWDQTNMTRKKRARIIQKFSGYRKVAVVFEKPDNYHDIAQWFKRLNSRTGKNIPCHIIESMESSYQAPDYTEGFDEIIHINSFEGEY